MQGSACRKIKNEQERIRDRIHATSGDGSLEGPSHEDSALDRKDSGGGEAPVAWGVWTDILVTRSGQWTSGPLCANGMELPECGGLEDALGARLGPEIIQYAESASTGCFHLVR